VPGRFAGVFERDSCAGRFCRILQHEPNRHQPHSAELFFAAGLADADPEIARRSSWNSAANAMKSS